MSATDLETLLRDAYAASDAGGAPTPTYQKTEEGRGLLAVGLATLPVEHRIVFLAVDGSTSLDGLARQFSAIADVAGILLDLERKGYIGKV
jgi:hypothetical protein